MGGGEGGGCREYHNAITFSDVGDLNHGHTLQRVVDSTLLIPLASQMHVLTGMWNTYSEGGGGSNPMVAGIKTSWTVCL